MALDASDEYRNGLYSSIAFNKGKALHVDDLATKKASAFFSFLKGVECEQVASICSHPPVQVQCSGWLRAAISRGGLPSNNHQKPYSSCTKIGSFFHPDNDSKATYTQPPYYCHLTVRHTHSLGITVLKRYYLYCPSITRITCITCITYTVSFMGI
jgi:ribosomal protein S27E